MKDKEDEAAEILETIRFVCYDIPDIQQMMDDEGTFRKYDETSFEAMEAFCNGYNNAVDSYLAKQVSIYANALAIMFIIIESCVCCRKKLILPSLRNSPRLVAPARI